MCTLISGLMFWLAGISVDIKDAPCKKYKLLVKPPVSLHCKLSFLHKIHTFVCFITIFEG